MRPRLSVSSRRAYSGITGHQFIDEQPQGQPTLATGPTLRRIDGPDEVVETAVAILDEATMGGRARNRYLSRARQRRLGMDAEGKLVLEGRGCCLELAQQLDREMHRLVLPVRRVCPGCGTTWAVEMAPREERRHAWSR